MAVTTAERTAPITKRKKNAFSDGQGALAAMLLSPTLLVLLLVAGIPIVAAISAPTDLAVDAARRLSMTLIGFLRGDGFNIYTGEERVALG